MIKSNRTDESEIIAPEERQLGWLQRLKEESWEAELLVSAIAIFGTFQLFHLIDWWTNQYIDFLNPSQYFIGYMIVFMGLLAISILVSMFVIHFFLRAYWIGLVGLNSVFPDYSIEDSAYSKIYTEKILSILPKLKDSIQKVDELCSIIFSVAFTFLLIYMYMAVFASLYLIIFNLLSDYASIQVLLIPAYFIAVCVLVQTIISIFANIKRFKENQTIQLWYFKIVRFTSILVMGPLYKSVMQVAMIFGSNFKKKKSMIYMIIFFVFSGMFVTTYQMMKTNIPYLIAHERYFDETRAYAAYYKTENEENNFLLAPEIESDKVQSNILKLYIPIFKHELKTRDEICGKYVEDPNISRLEQRKALNKYKLNCYNKYNIVYIDGKKIKVEYLRYKHPRTKQTGLIAYMNLSELDAGMHRINIKKEFENLHIAAWTIPFYYTPKQK